jgi:very-short-patch-repair endonuclease
VVVTSPAQTLADLGAVCDADIVERAAESALRMGLADDPALREFAVSQTRARHGGPMLREVLKRRPLGARPTGSDVETIALQILRRDGLLATRQWEVTEDDGRHVDYCDLGFPPKAFVVEIDGLGTHGLEQRQHDYNRQARIEDIGYIVRRFTAEDVLYRPRYLCAVTRRGLARAPFLRPDAPTARLVGF